MRTKFIFPSRLLLASLMAISCFTAKAADERPLLPPQVRLVSPPNGAVFPELGDIHLIAAAKDPDGIVRSVEFFAGNESLGVVKMPPILIEPTIGLNGVEGDPPDWLPIGPFHLLWEDVQPGKYVLTAVATDNSGLSSKSEPVEITVLAGPPFPVVNILAKDPEASEGGVDEPDTATFIVSRRGGVEGPLTVYYKIDGKAANGEDYEELPSNVTIEAGAESAEIVITPKDDEELEGDESVIIALASAPCDGLPIEPLVDGCYLVGRHGIARAVIHDNEVPPNHPPAVRIVNPREGEVFIAPANIRLAANAWDLEGIIRSVEFFDGDTSLGVATAQDIFIPADDEWPIRPLPVIPVFTLPWENVKPGSYVLTAVATDENGATGISEPIEIKVVERILPPVVSIIATDPEASEPFSDQRRPENPAMFTLYRRGGTEEPLTVHYRIGGTAKNGIDYSEIPNEATFPVGADSVEIFIVALHDELVEGPESVVISLVPHSCLRLDPAPEHCYVTGHQSMARAVILDNDVSPENGPPVVHLISPPDGAIFIAPVDLTLYAAAWDPDGRVESVEFFDGDTSLGVVMRDNAGGHPWDLFRLRWEDVPPGMHGLTARATDDDGASTTSSPSNIRVLERPHQPIITVRATDEVGTEQSPLIDALPDNAAFTLHRKGGNMEEALTVYYGIGGSASNGEDYEKLSGEATFPPNEDSVEIVVEVIDDELVEGTETVVIELRPILCLPVEPPDPHCYRIGAPDRAVAYIRDNEQEPNQKPRLEIVRPANGQMFEAPANIRVLVAGRDPDGWIPMMELFSGDEKIGEQVIFFIQPPPPGLPQEFEFEWNEVPAGEYVLTARATDSSGESARSESIKILVKEPGPRIPTVTIVAVDPFACEKSSSDELNTATFKISRTGEAEGDLMVWYSVHGTAENGVDYDEIGHTILIRDGSRSARVVIKPIDDEEPERFETVVLKLEYSPTASPVDPYRIGRPGRAAALIADNDHDRPHCRRLPDGLFHLCVPGWNGFAFRVEGSDDLRTWVHLCTNVVTEDRIQFIDPEGSEHPRRFYRIVPEPDFVAEE